MTVVGCFSEVIVTHVEKKLLDFVVHIVAAVVVHEGVFVAVVATAVLVAVVVLFVGKS